MYLANYTTLKYNFILIFCDFWLGRRQLGGIAEELRTQSRTVDGRKEGKTGCDCGPWRSLGFPLPTRNCGLCSQRRMAARLDSARLVTHITFYNIQLRTATYDCNVFGYIYFKNFI
eukprot:GEMP01127107.1.p1 GENE.GEMP01127107.1~~GEMP01127107.1.p1  ORF type:complete len:116 (-),score=4.83 GEMP01127107.1:16-363(-)